MPDKRASVEDSITRTREEIAELKTALQRAVGWRREAIAEKIVDFEDALDDMREMIGDGEL